MIAYIGSDTSGRCSNAKRSKRIAQRTAYLLDSGLRTLQPCVELAVVNTEREYSTAQLIRHNAPSCDLKLPLIAGT